MTSSIQWEVDEIRYHTWHDRDRYSRKKCDKLLLFIVDSNDARWTTITKTMQGRGTFYAWMEWKEIWVKFASDATLKRQNNQIMWSFNDNSSQDKKYLCEIFSFTTLNVRHNDVYKSFSEFILAPDEVPIKKV